ncbi:MAG: hypothetical protein U0790_07470 [Isosphaeraceae bacterium]
MSRAQGWIVARAIFWVVLAAGTQGYSASAVAGEWILPESRMGIRTAPILLLSRPDIQADLRLDSEQIAGAREMINELTRRATALRGKAGGEVVAERRAIDEAQLDWLSRNLTGNQLERLRQLEMQWEGVSAMLSRPMVAEYLKLSAEQRQSLARLIAEQNSARKRSPGAGADDRAFAAKVLGVLSQAQQEQWKNLLGMPLSFVATTAPDRTRDDAAQRAGHVQKQP